MLFYPNAKINIGLNIVHKRTDGYHDLETVFYPIPFSDILEIVPNSEGGIGDCQISQSGITFDGAPKDNICSKAYYLLAKDFQIPSVTIHLHKQIPVGAGLGGGSSDAAFTLKGLNAMFNLAIPTEKLAIYASKLGADCAFFIDNSAKYAKGIGDEFTDCNVNLAGKYLVLICPTIHSSTAEAYSMVKPTRSKDLLSVIQSDISEWKKTIFNDFENSIFPLYPEVEDLKLELYAKGALFASMSGSGSSVFGIFEEHPNCYFELGDTNYQVFAL